MNVQKALEFVHGRLALRYERAAARAGKKDWASRTAADLSVIHRHGWLNDQQYQQALTSLKNAPKEKQPSWTRYLSEHYFDTNGELANSIRGLNYHAALVADVKAVAAAGGLSQKDARDVLQWANSDVGVDLKSELDYLHAHHPAPKGGWYSQSLTLPSY